MNISCNVIRDILPLYAEDMVCDETKKLVDEHLCGCDACTKELGRLKKKEAIPVSVDTAPMEHIRKTIRKRQILTTVCVIMTILSLVWSGMVFMTAPIYLPVDKAIEGVELRDGIGLDIDYARGIMGKGSRYGSDGDRYICVTTTRYDWIKGRMVDRKFQAMSREEQDAYIRELYDTDELTQKDYDRFWNHDIRYYLRDEMGRYTTEEYLRQTQDSEEKLTQAAPGFDIWYLSANGKPETLLWNGGDGVYPEEDADFGENQGEMFVKRVFYGSLICMMLFLGMAYFLKKSKWKKPILIVGVGAASVLAYTLLFTGGNFSDVIGCRLSYWDNYMIFTCLLLTVTALLWLYRHDLNKKGTF